MTLIILEGNEANFKTTVANKLSKLINFPVVKGSTFEHAQCTNEELFEKFKELSELDNTILDRFIYSNRVYATLYRDFAILTNDQRKEIEERIKGKATLIYLHADDEIIKQRIEQRGDDYVDTDMVSAINNEYIKTINEAGIQRISYNTSEWNSDEIVRDIAKCFI
jgi:thymidylate kinase